MGGKWTLFDQQTGSSSQRGEPVCFRQGGERQWVPRCRSKRQSLRVQQSGRGDVRCCRAECGNDMSTKRV